MESPTNGLLDVTRSRVRKKMGTPNRTNNDVMVVKRSRVTFMYLTLYVIENMAANVWLCVRLPAGNAKK
jgi:hypothetical protein